MVFDIVRFICFLDFAQEFRNCYTTYMTLLETFTHKYVKVIKRAIHTPKVIVLACSGCGERTKFYISGPPPGCGWLAERICSASFNFQLESN